MGSHITVWFSTQKQDGNMLMTLNSHDAVKAFDTVKHHPIWQELQGHQPKPISWIMRFQSPRRNRFNLSSGRSSPSAPVSILHTLFHLPSMLMISNALSILPFFLSVNAAKTVTLWSSPSCVRRRRPRHDQLNITWIVKDSGNWHCNQPT